MEGRDGGTVLKVIFVDDEPYVIEGLKVMLDWEVFGFKIYGEASNGDDALELVRLCDPDLIITDIRMPGMDGLEFIRQACEKLHSKAKFIILSGYSEFAFAQKAMLYNASNYLLKPLDDAELGEVVSRLSGKILEERKREQDTNRRISFIANQTICRIISGDMKSSVLGRADILLGINEGCSIRGVVFDMDELKSCFHTAEGEDLAAGREKARSLIEAELGPDFMFHVFEDDEERYGIIATEKMPIYSFLEGFASRLAARLGQETGGTVAATVSEPMNGADSIGILYRQCIFALNFRFFLEDTGVIRYADIKNADIHHELYTGTFDDLMEVIGSNDRDRLSQKVQELFEGFRRERVAPEAVRIYVKNVELEIIKLIAELEGDIEKISHSILCFNKDLERLNIQGFRQTFLEICLMAAAQVEQLKQRNPQDLAGEVRDYIKQNYKKDIKLKKLAQEFFVNPVYLGQLFKKATGMQFNEYLHTVRIHEAKRLLKMTGMRVSEVASAVGYNDTEYFTGKFKAVTNQLPSEYKNA